MMNYWIFGVLLWIVWMVWNITLWSNVNTNVNVNTHVNNVNLNTWNANTWMFYYWWKDHLFTRTITKYVDWYDIVDYNQKRDLEDVDEIDVDKAYPKYVSLDLKNKEKYKKFSFENSQLEYYEIRWWTKFAVIFIHWLNWNKTWWFKDWTFWWNFNRLKHIAYNNKWMYISPTITSFWYWAKQVWWLIKALKKENWKMKIFLACWSSWWETCWKVYDDTDIPLDWILLLWSMKPYLWMKQLLKRKIPIYYGHWEKDKSMSVQWSIAVYKEAKKLWHKIHLDVFTNWVHWTPIRMIDWLKTLRWLVNESNTLKDLWKNVKDAEHFDWIKELYPNWINLKK